MSLNYKGLHSSCIFWTRVGGGGGVGVNWWSFWYGCADRHSKPTPFIYLGLANRDLFIYLPFKTNTHKNTCLENIWMDELGFYVPSTVFQSFRDDGRVNMKGSVQ